MKEQFMLTVIAALPVTTIVAIIAGLVVAVIIAIVSVILFRSSGKKKGTKATTNASAIMPMGATSAEQGQQEPWNQAGMAANNAWSQQQASPWGQQPQQAAWSQPSQQPGGWNPSGSAQQSPPAWGTQNNAQQQQPGGWGQTAQGASGPAQQPAWGAQNAAQQQSSASPWGAASAQSANPWTGQSAQPSWDAPPAASNPDSWGSPPSSTPSAAPWAGASSQQAQPAYGAGSGPSWAQSAPSNAPGSVDHWSNPAGQQPYSGMGVQSAPPNSPPAMPSWQQTGVGSSGADSDKTILRSTGAQMPGTLGFVRVEEGKEPGRVYDIRKEVLSIGRSRDSDIFLEDLAVSRLHASIQNMGNGNYTLKDEGSANGTKVNGQLVAKYQPQPLQEGDRIQLGQTVLVFSRQ